MRYGMFALLTLTLLMSTRLGAQDSTAPHLGLPSCAGESRNGSQSESRNSSDSPTSR